MSIIQLDRHVADLIAAGEVVERPASAVKELVENAIDAGAHSVTVEIQNGGMTYLRVTDDGCGMTAEDARIAFLRHATSKLRTKEDLSCIHTLGFRGEALAAISSVSRIDLLTRPADSAFGLSLHLEAGRITDEQEAGCPEGTTLIVRDLFYNTPARMKFMKSDSAEAAAVAGVLQQQALAHPDVCFRFIKDGAEQLHTAGDSDRLAAVYCIFGRELAGNLVEVNGSWEKIRVRGYAARPTATRGNRSWQYFFVNGRYVKSRMLCSALEEAYKNQIMVGRFPACVLEVQLPVQAVDVNVHPAKTEVRFLSEREVFDAVHYAVLSALNRAPGRPEMKLPQKPVPAAQLAPSASAAPQKPSSPAAKATPSAGFYKTMQADEYRRQLAAQSSDKAERRAPVSGGKTPVVAQSVLLPTVEKPAVQSAAQDKAPQPPAKKAAPPACQKPDAPSFAGEEAEQTALSMQELSFRIIGEALNSYILVEQGRSILFIDKHAAHERILFEKLKKEDHPVMAQRLIAPITANLSQEESAAVLQNAELMAQCGFLAEEFGPGGMLVLREIPADISLEQAPVLLQELAGKLLGGRRLQPESLRDELLHSIACKAAIKAGWLTQAEEREALVREVLSRDDIKYCPHGRPVCITVSEKQLEKQFGRT